MKLLDTLLKVALLLIFFELLQTISFTYTYSSSNHQKHAFEASRQTVKQLYTSLGAWHLLMVIVACGWYEHIKSHQDVWSE